MGFNISDNSILAQLNRNLSKAREEQADTIGKLSTGKVFTPQDPRPADRAIAETMEYRIRSLNSAKRNVNDSVSMLNTAESGMNEIANIVTRMKEINLTAASSTISNQERRYLFIEYEALHDEINRITKTTEFNGIPLLYGESDKVPDSLVFRLGDPYLEESLFGRGEDVNTITFRDIKNVNTTTQSLGILSARELLEDTSDIEGVELEDIEDFIIPEEEDIFPTSYDQALTILSTNRAIYGALQSRFNRVLDYIDVYQENIEAAKSKISDTDYAQEVANLLKSKVLISANTALLAQSAVDAQQTLQLLNAVT